MISPELLEILACPKCDSRPAVKLRENFLICTECEFAYRIVDNIPNMLPEDAIPPVEWKKELNDA